jgi:hypothetical protein
VKEQQEIINRVYLRYPRPVSPENRIAEGKLYSGEDRALWQIKQGACLDVTADGIVVQQFEIEVERVYGPALPRRRRCPERFDQGARLFREGIRRRFSRRRRCTGEIESGFNQFTRDTTMNPSRPAPPVNAPSPSPRNGCAKGACCTGDVKTYTNSGTTPGGNAFGRVSSFRQPMAMNRRRLD